MEGALQEIPTGSSSRFKDPREVEYVSETSFLAAPQARDQYGTRKQAPSRVPKLMVLCLLLHIILVLMHVAALVVLAGRYEHRVTMRIDKFTTTWVPLIVGTALRAFATIYTAVLVLLTQRLALRKALNTPQTLTALHDKTSAWLGIGSAAVSLWQQGKLRTAVWGISGITLYLLGVFVVHISIPGVLEVQVYNATVSVQSQTRLANANYTANLMSAYDILLVYGQLNKIGLLDNMVYDIVPLVADATGNATVNASIYDVQCMALQDVQTNPTGVVYDSYLTTTNYIVNNTKFIFPLPYYQAVFAGWTDPTSAACNPSSSYCAPVYIGSTVAIVDSSGTQPPSSTGNSWIESPRVVQTLDVNTPVLITGMQIVACVVNITDTQIDVSATTLEPFSSPAAPSDASWTTYAWPDGLSSSDPRLIAAQNAPPASPQCGHCETAHTYWVDDGGDNPSPPVFVPVDADGFPVVSGTNPVQLGSNGKPQGVGTASPQSPTAFDAFIQEELGIAAQNRSSITLPELNHAVAKALAAVHWYGQQLNFADPHVASGMIIPGTGAAPSSVKTEQPEPVIGAGQATIVTVLSQYRLSLNLVAVLVGLAVSTIMLVLAAALLSIPWSNPLRTSRTVDSAGILQITWLLGHEPNLAAVEKPDIGALRAAGMFQAQMREYEREKTTSFGDFLY